MKTTETALRPDRHDASDWIRHGIPFYAYDGSFPSTEWAAGFGFVVESGGKVVHRYVPTPKGLDFHESQAPNCIIEGSRGTGKSLCIRNDAHMRALACPNYTYLVVRRTMPELKKAVALDTPIPTPTGWTTMGEVQEQDLVLASDGTPTRVLWKSPAQCDLEGTFRLTFDNGESVIASAGHQWTVRTRTDRQRGRSRVLTTKDIARQVRSEGDQRATYAIALAGVWQLPSQDLPIDPYTLGVWLGDGTSGQGAYSSNDPEIADEIRRVGYTVVKRVCHTYEWSIYGLMTQLRALGILHQKAVPPVYERASADQRLALLQGLMDTDGCCSKDGLCIFVQTEERRQIVESVYRLAASLGLKPRRFAHRVHDYHTGLPTKMAYGVRWVGDVPVFRLSRKLVRLPRSRKGSKARAHYIVSCERIADTPCQCIAVEHPSHEYLITHSSIITHNSHLRFIGAEMKALGGSYHHTDAIAYYPNGSQGFFGHCQTEDDMLKLLSSQYDAIYFDEISTFTWSMITKIGSCTRVEEGSGKLAVVRGGTNPIGIGASEVREHYVSKDVSLEQEPDYDPAEWESVHTILDDNPFVDKQQYIRRLSSLPEHVRRAWLDGEWVIEGAYFHDYWPILVVGPESPVKTRAAFQPKTRLPWHMVNEIPIVRPRRGEPDLPHRLSWIQVYRALDWGFSPDPAVCLWIAVLSNSRALVFKEKHWRSTPARQVAKEIVAESEGMHIADTYCDPSIFFASKATDLTSIGDIIENNHVPLVPSTNDRAAAGFAIHEYLNTVLDDGLPQLQIYEPGCPMLCRTLPEMRTDDHDPKKIANHPRDHWTITLAYFCLGSSGVSREAHVDPKPRWMRPNPRLRKSSTARLGAESVRSSLDGGLRRALKGA